MALGVGISHRLADASTTSMFIHGWACSALGSGEAVPRKFGAASRIPPRREFTPTPPATHLVVEKSATRRYVFDASKIVALKAKAANVEKPTHVEAVSTLIWRCATSVSKSKYGSPRPSKLIQMINIRKKLLPPSSENCFGNLVWCFEAQTCNGCSDIELHLHILAGELRKGIEGFTENHAAKFQRDEAFSVVSKSYKEIDSLYTTEIMRFFCCSSWCRFPIYETNFG
ncbi:hypothetical protein FH972_009325 [Carpinus fangiana]|uniref:Uncharacterized protein n=1 Tax=Carpinus fangiana TaxID=176857 RepID=A0A5N6R1I2_9ROSI|nr:hypothetical protein FH972_009325 [Carpinus fangiana]